MVGAFWPSLYVVQVLATAAIAFIGARIAYRQATIASEKLRFDLFGRRFEALRYFLDLRVDVPSGEFRKRHPEDHTAVRELNAKQWEVNALFGPDVQQHVIVFIAMVNKLMGPRNFQTMSDVEKRDSDRELEEVLDVLSITMLQYMEFQDTRPMGRRPFGVIARTQHTDRFGPGEVL